MWPSGMCWGDVSSFFSQRNERIMSWPQGWHSKFSLKSSRQLMASPKMKIRKECCWLLSNICAGPLYQVQQIRDHGFFNQSLGLDSVCSLYYLYISVLWLCSWICVQSSFCSFMQIYNPGTGKQQGMTPNDWTEMNEFFLVIFPHVSRFSQMFP